MAVKYLSGNRLWGTDAERLAMSYPDNPPKTAWKEIARSNHTGTGSTLTALSDGNDYFTPKDHMMFVWHIIGAGSAGQTLEFGTGSGFDATHDGGVSDYYKNRYNGNYTTGADPDANDDGGIYCAHDASTTAPGFGYGTIMNIDGKEHLVNLQGANFTAGTAGTVQTREVVAKYTRTDQITQARIRDTWGAGYAVGSELVVLGMDNDEADAGSAFWEQLVYKTSTSVDSSPIALDTGIFDVKNYLWVQVHTKAKSGQYANAKWQFNEDTGSNYYTRTSDNGANGVNQSASDSIMTRAGEYSDSNAFTQAYIGNTATTTEKWYIGHTAQATTGDSTQYRNEFVGKWLNTSEQIDQLVLKSTSSSGTNLAEATIVVWGHD